MVTNLLKQEIDESTPPQLLAGIDNLLRKINLGDNWQKFFIYRLSLFLFLIITAGHAVLYSENVVSDIMIGWGSSFLWCFVLSNWSLTRKLLAWWSSLFIVGITLWLIFVIIKLF